MIRGEVLASLAYSERYEFSDRETNGALGFQYVPTGGNGWRGTARERIVDLILSADMKSRLLDAGFAKGDEAFLVAALDNMARIAGRMQWM